MITKQLAEEIVELTMVKLHHNINVMDTNGVILASGEKERIGKLHEGAAYVAKTGEILRITEDNINQFPGTKTGINMPIHFQQQLVGVIGITGNPNEIEKMANLLQLTTEMMVHQSLVTTQVEWKRKMKELVFEELTISDSISTVLMERLRFLRFKNTAPFTVILVSADEFLPSSRRVIEQLEEQFRKDSALVGHSKLNRLFILVSGMDEKKLKRKFSFIINMLFRTNPTVKIGVGYSVHSLNDIHYSYITAENALEFGYKEKRLVYFEDIELIFLLRKNPKFETERFSKRVLNGLNDSLIHTLSIFFDCSMNVTDSAAILKIHRHTMTYRLRKIKELTGYDPTNFQDAVQLHIAILLHDR